ncbi:MAG TPA: bifunctional phosphoglucose/phosphomannose isomerase [bacterium]|nr:bifunctional phosphoglucose/phosphomannose isomerase [bacterium]
MTNLDQNELIQTLDKADMASYILALPSQIEESLLKIKQMTIPADWKKIDNICFVGMGGSATAGDLVANLPALDLKIPLTVVRDFQLPNWVNKNTLVVIVSHSGNTEETLAAFKYAAAKEAKMFVIAERGDLEQLAEKEKAVIFDYDTLAQPRAAMGFQLGAIFGLLKKINIISYTLEPSLQVLKKLNQELNPDVQTENNLAKNLAYFCFDHLPIIVASGILKTTAWRWKTQFNENAKTFAFTENLPECMHNSIEGLDYPARFRDDFVYLILANAFETPELLERQEKLKNILQEKNIAYELVEAVGEDVFSQKLSLLLLGDWLSYYLALLNNVDPTPVLTIEKAKKP